METIGRLKGHHTAWPGSPGGTRPGGLPWGGSDVAEPVFDFASSSISAAASATYSLRCSSFLGLPFRILNIELVKPKKELQWRL